MGNAKSTGQTRADVLARNDALLDSGPNHRAFTAGTRPVMRWIKGDGLDDAVTRAAIGAATRLFGESVDYCLCTNGIHPERAREILSWAAQPVEWWPLAPADNPPLRDRLSAAGCPPEHFGYWWKWFPERVRPHGPEWILDGDMVVTGKPTWFGTLGDGRLVLGLPGNPASALVCAELFLRPLVNAMLGLDPGPVMEQAQLGTPLPSNGPREHWMRAKLENRLGMIVATPFRDQDSSLISVFAKADALICQPAQCGGLEVGSLVQILRLNRL